jgi:hypothetical protein
MKDWRILHEGIVHDAMACASFLKFHPDLNKEMSKFANKKKQERIRVRHATDSSKELNKKRENLNINEARVRFNLEPQFLRSDSEKSDKSDKSEKSDKHCIMYDSLVPQESSKYCS